MIRGDWSGGKHAIGYLIGLTPGLVQIALIAVRLRMASFTLYPLQSAYDFQQCALIIIHPSHYFILRLYNSIHSSHFLHSLFSTHSFTRFLPPHHFQSNLPRSDSPIRRLRSSQSFRFIIRRLFRGRKLLRWNGSNLQSAIAKLFVRDSADFGFIAGCYCRLSFMCKSSPLDSASPSTPYAPPPPSSSRLPNNPPPDSSADLPTPPNPPTPTSSTLSLCTASQSPVSNIQSLIRNLRPGTTAWSRSMLTAL
jgi:hypothetical protein